MGSIEKDNWKLYNEGNDVSLGRGPYEFATVKEINDLEKKLEKYSKKFGEETVFVEWGQGYGGPSDGFKAHRKREILEMLLRYEKENVKGIYPKIGLVIDSEWINEMRDFLRKNKKDRKNRDQEYLRQYLKLISQGLF